MTIPQVKELSKASGDALRSKFAYTLINKNVLTVEQALKLTPAANRALQSENVYALINKNVLTIEQVLKLTPAASSALQNQYVYGLIMRELLTEQRLLSVREVLRLTDAESRILLRNLNHYTYRLLIRELLTIQQLKQALEHSINDAQSTHFASVHKSVSKSILALSREYCLEKLSDKDITNEIDKAIQRIQRYQGEVSCDSLEYKKYEVAIRCIQRLANNPDFPEESITRITIRQLIALAFIAIKDENIKIDGKPLNKIDALKALISGFCDIQLGDNPFYSLVWDNQLLDPDDLDLKDSFICPPGTYNKIIESLCGLHPLCEIVTITKSTASLKLRSLAKTEAENYLRKRIVESKTPKKFKDTHELIQSIKAAGNVLEIWEPIKKEIADQILQEGFGELFSEKSISLEEFINNGYWAELDPSQFDRLDKALQSHAPISKEEAGRKLLCLIKTEAEAYLIQLANPSNRKKRDEFRQLRDKVEVEGIIAIWDKIRDTVLNEIKQQGLDDYYPKEAQSLDELIDNKEGNLKLDSTQLDRLKTTLEGSTFCRQQRAYDKIQQSLFPSSKNPYNLLDWKMNKDRDDEKQDDSIKGLDL